MSKPLIKKDPAKRIKELESLNNELQQKVSTLRKSEEIFRSIMESMPGIVYRCALDNEWTMFFMNEYIEQTTGYPSSDFINNAVRTYESIIYTEDAEYVDLCVREAVQSRKPWEIEYRVVHKDGNLLWVYEKGSGIIGEDGKIKYLEGIIFDITARKKAGEVRDRILARQQKINKLQEKLLGPGSLIQKVKSITDSVVESFQADFCRIWIIRPGDLCESGCIHGLKENGPNACIDRDRCLHLVSSSGRYSHVDGGHQRVPIGAYKIGRLAVGPHTKFLSNNVTEDPQIHDHEWAGKLGLQSFAGYPLRDIKGETVGVLALFSKHIIEPEEDVLLESLGHSTAQIIQKSKTEDFLRESEEKYRRIFNNEIDAISVFDIETRKILDVNDAFSKLYGYRFDEALQLTIDDVSAEPDKTIATVEKVAKEGDTFIPVRHHKKKDGTPITVEISAGPFTWKGQRVMFTVSRDITEQLKDKEALSRSEEKYRNLFHYSNDGIYLHDLKGRIIEANQKAFEQSGIMREVLLSSNISDIVAPESGKKVHQLFQAISDKGFVNIEMIGKKKNGEFFPVDVSSILLDMDGERIVQSVVRDISERKKLEEELLKVQKLESTGILAGGIAHDFNNLLMSIMGNVSLAKAYPNTNDQILDKLDDAEKASIRAQGLAQQLLTFSKGGEPVRKPVVLNDILREAISFVLSGSNVKSDFDVDDNLLPVFVDEGQISQVIQNVIKNADQAMPDGGVVTIRARNRSINQTDALPLADGKYVEIIIKDTGIGILKDDLPKVFDPYFSTKKEGSGLGLASVYSIIKNHDGFITVDSERDIETTFHIYLPISEEVPATLKVEEEKTVPRTGKILIMDDDEKVARVVSEMLKFMGHTIESVKDGNEAIAIYQTAQKENRPFDVVMLDLTIPGGMGGKETVEKLQEIDPKVKAIVSSGYATDTIMADYEQFGFKGVVAKPYNLQKLKDVLYELLA